MSCRAIQLKGFCLFCLTCVYFDCLFIFPFIYSLFVGVLSVLWICFTVCIWPLQLFIYYTKRPPRRSNGENSKYSLLLMMPMRSWPQDRKICLPSLFLEVSSLYSSSRCVHSSALRPKFMPSLFFISFLLSMVTLNWSFRLQHLNTSTFLIQSFFFFLLF